MVKLEDIRANFNKSSMTNEEADLLAESIMKDSQRRESEAVGFGDSIEHNVSSEKEFGETIGSIESEDKLMEFMVVDDSTIEYKNSSGEPELFTFEKTTMESLGKKLDGIPLMLGGHEDDFPIATFTKEFSIKEYEDMDGVNRTGLFAKARLREDKDSEIDYEALIKSPEWDVNGGDKQLKGSLKFTSKDVPVFFDNGAKINYMTQPVPRHFALVDVPVIKNSGLVNKNFGETMSESETPTDKTVEMQKQMEQRIKEALEGVDITEMVRGELVNTLVEKVTATVSDPDTVSRSEYDELKTRAEAAEQKLTDQELSHLEDKIVGKLGEEASEEDVEAVKEEIKEFGVTERKAYLAAMDKYRREPEGEGKSFGKGKVDTSDATGRTRRKIELNFQKGD